MAKLHIKYRDLELRKYGNKWSLAPRIEDLREIVEAADKAGVKVFLKENLKPLIVENLGHTFPSLAYREHLRQEMPNDG